MSERSVLWICPGSVAPYCAGQVGDVLVSMSAVQAIRASGYDLHVVTNRIIAEPLRVTYGIDVTEFADLSCLPDEVLSVASTFDAVFILRPNGDPVGFAWRRQLITSGSVMHSKIHQLGSLNAFADGPHMAEQMLAPARAVLGIPNAILQPPFMRLDNPRLDDQVVGEYANLILPFAGGPEKWLPPDLVSGLAVKLDGVTVIAGTPFGDERKALAEMKESTRALRDVHVVEDHPNQIALLAARSQRIVTVDGGICWWTVAGINWLVREGLLPAEHVPDISVILGRDSTWGLAPTASVWKPLTGFDARVRQVNADQAKRLVDLTVDEIVAYIERSAEDRLDVSG